MRGLLIKDFINLKAQSRVMLVVFAFYVIMGIVGGNREMFSFVMIFLMIMLPITAMAYDERSKWDKYALTMPVSRQDLVISKYLLGLILAGTAFLLNIVLQLLAGAESIGEVLPLSLGILGFALLVMAILLPLNFKFGVEKGRLLMMMVLFLPAAVIMILAKAGSIPPIPDNLDALAIYAGIGVVMVFLISITISLRIMSRKEM